MDIINNYITSKNRPGTKRARTTKIAVHYVGNPGTTAEANRNYFQQTAKDVSSNYIIGLDGEIIYCIPDNEIAWCTSQANSYSISIECCHPKSDGKFNDKTYNSLVELVAYLLKKYKLTASDVIRHYDVTGKVCPRGFVPCNAGGTDDINNTAYKTFLADVKKAFEQDTKPATVKPTKAKPTSAIKIKVGSKVKLKKGCKDYNGKSLADFVYNRVSTVSEIKGNRAVLTYAGVIVAAVKLSDLIII